MSLYLDFTLRVLAAQIAVSRWFGFEPPLTPSPDEARDLVRQELSKTEYQEKRDWLQEFLSWLLRPLQGLFDTDTPVPTEPFIAVLIVGLLALVGWLLYTRLIRAPKQVEETAEDTLVDPRISAEEYRQLASNLRASDPEEAVKAAFRAIIARMDQSGLTSTAPGRTVGDVTRAISARYPELRKPAQECAKAFDIAAYALLPNGRVDVVDVDQVLYLDDQVKQRLQKVQVKA